MRGIRTTTEIDGALRPVGLAAVLLLLSAAGLAAAPLDKEACDKLKAEIVQMERTGVKSNKARGPEWAKAHLAPDKLAEIARLIEAEEQVAFRCPQPIPPAERAEPARPASAPKGKKLKAQPDSSAASAADTAAKAGPSAPAPAKTAKAKKKPTRKAQQKSKPEGASTSPAASDTATPTPRQP